MPKPSARERILDAYEELLVEHGPAAVTLDAVAARSGVSKGGLLYHFGSKEALLHGLLDRLRALNEADIERATAAPEGVARYYLRSSVSDVTEDRPLHRTSLAIIRLMTEPEVRAAVAACTGQWRELLGRQLTDPLAVELVLALGDGLYLRAALDEPSESIMDNLTEVLHRIGAPT
ncbi:DNA-binding transcriptional regulator, AcrR family [Amycolatopsis arida]|uniref:DNA-binding transcriptional regulator, AcrR family n=1 Tax=Amycolatopsis arida TaxID=587909 RepID=A0A1I5T4T3_9PSEU|nr:TetR/AcrR family transcriptional regulator [Amycolatopsis arida]TDX96230.1 AcrR family transcriptional regulator [Amycolatopsis arida]SFP78023.1 DNA-binding transcriptional regulator, AcrR family [Amycolatopsis arida]